MKKHEGELTFHARTKEGGVCLYIATSNGLVYLIDNDRSSNKLSPYMNKFGETFNKTSKRWDNFYIDEEGGGTHVYEELKRIYMNNLVPNEIVSERGKTDSVFRLRFL
jgi:hypothetical protein